MNNIPLSLVWLLFALIFFILIVDNYLEMKNQYQNQYLSTYISLDDGRSTTCRVAEWNRKTTSDVPYLKNFSDWAKEGLNSFNIIHHVQPRLVGAYVYPDQISIVTTAMATFGSNATCLYFDCNRVRIPDSDFKSIVAPLTVISCARRSGAEFVTVKYDNDNDEPIEEPIPLTFKVYNEPVHELSVCVGPLYGNESKWLEIVEYVEHYRLLNVSWFYFTLFEIDEYDRKIIDDYERLGLAETKTVLIEYDSIGWPFHLIQTQDCHHRSRYHSKWVINVDIDERLVYTGKESLLHYLRSMPSNIGEFSFSVNRVLRTEPLPDRYTNSSDLPSEMVFLKYNQTTELSWYNLKGIIRPEVVFFLFYHWSYRQMNGIQVMSVRKSDGHFRHYRTARKNELNADWMKYYHGGYSETRLEPAFERELVDAVGKRAAYVYDQRTMPCDNYEGWVTQDYTKELMHCL